MTKITNIIFNPQNIDDTIETLYVANTLIDNGEKVTLEPSSNLISTQCLAQISSDGFMFSICQNKFVK